MNGDPHSSQPLVVRAGTFTFEVASGDTILNAARKAGVDVPHTCGGQGECRTCRFSIESGEVSPKNEVELRNADLLGSGRLACQCRLLSNATLKFAGPLREGAPVMGDIGIRDGEGSELAVASRPNQRLDSDRSLLVGIADALDMTQTEMNSRLAAIDRSDREEIKQGSLRPAPGFGSEGYTEEEYRSARRRERLLYFNIEFTNKCNLACTGCFAGFGDVKNVYKIDSEPGYKHLKRVEGPLILEEILDLVNQAADLGAKTVDLIGGGEPLISELFFPIAEHAVGRGLEVEVFTNGTLILPAMAQRMAELKILPFVKLYSARSWVHDRMVGKKGAWQKAVRGIENLLHAGYGGTHGPPIALETIVVRRNLADMPVLWRWARENGMIPYFERFVGCHYEGDPGALLSSIELKELWEELWLLDRGEYGVTWPLLPLRVGYTCATNFYSLYINYGGEVRPCSGVFLPLGNVRDTSLETILREQPIVKDLREYQRPSDSYCGSCFYYENDRCPGCRGMAVAAGSHMADDPLCFHNPANLRTGRDPRNSPHLKNQSGT